MHDLEAAERLRQGFVFDANDPLGSLRELTIAREALGAFERFLVRQARRDAATWDAIGAALRVSRQAAHRRHTAHVNEMRRVRHESGTARAIAPGRDG